MAPEQRCGQCGGTGHNRLTCKRTAGVRADGARVRELAPGVSGEDLAALDPVPGRLAERAVHVNGSTPSPGAPPLEVQRIPVELELRVHVIVTVEVRQ